MNTSTLHSPFICLVDDETNTLRAMRRTLIMAGYSNVEPFCDWVSAKEWLNRKQACLLILDIIMPGISGREALSEAKSLWPDLPVLMATGVNDAATAVECMKKGACDYLIKPIGGKDLVDCVKNVLLESNVLDVPAVRNSTQRASIRVKDITSSIEYFHPSRLAIPENEAEYDQNLAVRFVNYVKDPRHYGDPDLILKNTAEDLASNTTYLSNLVNRCWGMNFRTFLNSIRLSVFIEEARNSTSLTLSIEGLAKSVGFNRPSTFYTAFKDRFGITPARWLKS